MKWYAGIGSRRTPQDVLDLMEKAAAKLRNRGFVLRSGAADGADTAFERGAAGVAEIFLPWKGFNNHKSCRFHIRTAARELAEKHHPKWDYLSQGARRLHARNCYQILGEYLNQPVKFVLCWHNGTGGTLQAVRIAESLEIPVFNIRETPTRTRIEEFIA